MRLLSFIFLVFLFSGCSLDKEYTRAEIDELIRAESGKIIENSVYKPWKGESFEPETPGGVWYDVLSGDPKSFNLLIAEQDSATAGVVDGLYDYLVDYDYVAKEWVPRCAFFEIREDKENKRTSVYYRLRDNLYWSFYNSPEKIPVTSDDVVFWYNEIEGDPAFNSSAYNSQFVVLDDGTTARITIEKIDEKTFAFHFPRYDSNPLLSTNRSFGPSFIFKKAKEENGVQGVLDMFNVSWDVQEIPSMGKWFIKEYSPGLRVVFEKNPDYWEKDSAGNSLPYPDNLICSIIPDSNTQYLLFKQGQIETTGFTPDKLDDGIEGATDKTGRSRYTVYSSEGNLMVPFWSFNQNPVNKDKPYYSWFTKTEFRQAMSCLLDRDRIIKQIYRGLASPKYDFFASANPFYNPDITLKYRYNPGQALELLFSLGFFQKEGIMYDRNGNKVEFDLSIPADTSVYSEMASILSDSCKSVGITVNIRQVDFQKLVQQLTSTYDWQTVFIGLGANYWPTQGSNVWPSDGNLHLWYPLQKSPSTEWEARIDWLYNEGASSIDVEYSRKIWDEYQSILLEQCPVIYLVSSKSFVGVSSKWSQKNIYFDNVGGLNTDYAGIADSDNAEVWK